MPQITIVYWRSIPAQVIVGTGRRGKRVKLSERFEQAIDRAAMRSGASESDAYMAEWRRSEPTEREGDAATLANDEAKRLEQEYDKTRLGLLIANGGHE